MKSIQCVLQCGVIFALTQMGCEKTKDQSDGQQLRAKDGSDQLAGNGGAAVDSRLDNLSPATRCAAFLASARERIAVFGPGGLDSRQHAQLISQIRDLASNLPDELLRSLLADPESQGLKDPRTKELVLFAICELLASKSPEDFLKFLVENRDLMSNFYELGGGMSLIAKENGSLLAEWVKKDISENSIKNADQMASVCAVALSALARESPDQLLKLIGDAEFPWPVNGFIDRVAEFHPDVLMRAIDNPASDRRLVAVALSSLVVTLGTSDPDGAVQLLAKFKTAADGAYAASVLIGDLQKNSPEKVGEYALNFPPELLLNVFNNRAVDAASILTMQPDVARHIVEGVVATEANREKLKELVALAAQASPGDTIAWLEASDETPFSKELLAATVEQAVMALKPGDDPLRYLPDSGSRGYAERLEGIANALGTIYGRSGNLSDIFSAAGNLDPAQRSSFLESALSQASLFAPQAVAEAVAGAKDGVGVDENVSAQILGDASLVWGRKDPQAAANWVAERSEGAAKSKFVEGLVKQWVASDPKTAADWLSAQAPSKSRDAGIKVLVSNLVNTDPERANEWKAALTEP